MMSKLVGALLFAGVLSSANATVFTMRVMLPGARSGPDTGPPPDASFAIMEVLDQFESVSNQGLTITHTRQGNWSLGQATVGKSSGKWYWEATLINPASGALIGMMPAGAGQNYYYSGPGTLHYVGLIYDSSPPVPFWNTGATVGVLVDLDAKTIAYKVGCAAAVQGGTPLPGGVLYPFTEGQSGTIFTLNFGAQPFKCGVPNGYRQGFWQ